MGIELDHHFRRSLPCGAPSIPTRSLDYQAGLPTIATRQLVRYRHQATAGNTLRITTPASARFGTLAAWAVSSAGRAPALQAGGRWFEPGTAHLAPSAGGSYRPGATGLRSRLTPLAARRSTEPCSNTVSFGAAPPATPRERERRFGLVQPHAAGGSYRPGATGLPEPPDTAGRTILSEAV